MGSPAHHQLSLVRRPPSLRVMRPPSRLLMRLPSRSKPVALPKKSPEHFKLRCSRIPQTSKKITAGAHAQDHGTITKLWQRQEVTYSYIKCCHAAGSAPRRPP